LIISPIISFNTSSDKYLSILVFEKILLIKFTYISEIVLKFD
jgi:hypothetical protein